MTAAGETPQGHRKRREWKRKDRGKELGKVDEERGREEKKESEGRQREIFEEHFYATEVTCNH